jgi:hypothetical protein
MAKADRISGIFWLLFSILVSTESYRLGLGSLRKPGPGFFFFWTGMFLGLLSLIVILRSSGTRKPPEDQGAFSGKVNLAKIILVLVGLFLYALLMETLGFLIVSFFLFLFLLGIVEKKKWFLTLWVSLVVTVLTYVIFEIGLQSQLPKGILEFLRL